ncbi:hypothetical protein Salmi_Mp082 (mitochondrion) [Salvia miltiorrhiza]|uniref:Uncharacterized protein n=1 Tax=Salvia miltiorrhiza TaxID=226208 RepID=V9P4S4_SALMI|nr:hypothetical protein Salmi_Mp082 [Salvia miltiorrhiza]AGU16610.1 hypothetical protein Salmi_Mp082 [Salvia miltiorrhiza]
MPYCISFPKDQVPVTRGLKLKGDRAFTRSYYSGGLGGGCGGLPGPFPPFHFSFSDKAFQCNGRNGTPYLVPDLLVYFYTMLLVEERLASSCPLFVFLTGVKCIHLFGRTKAWK